ncbi:hypothetical protein Tco_1478565 [Tanacetum coccineum]
MDDAETHAFDTLTSSPSPFNQWFLFLFDGVSKSWLDEWMKLWRKFLTLLRGGGAKQKEIKDAYNDSDRKAQAQAHNATSTNPTPRWISLVQLEAA